MMSFQGVLQLRPRGSTLLLLLLLTATVTRADDDETCEDLMEDNDSNKHYACGPRGQVVCQKGWSGDLCNIPKCRVDCHPLHGYCERPGECKCALGWRGGRCDRCTPLPGCQNGFCNSTSFECVCEEGWDGKFCNQPKCREGCHNTRGYCEAPGECKCRIGWGGDKCDVCKPLHGCANGYCTKPLECKCHEGWTGLLCQIPICTANCSIRHGSCTKPGECRCEVGWWGETCNECFAYPGCQNGYCTKPWECVCKEGWEGMTCDRRSRRKPSFCNRNPSACLNGGTCINVPGNRNFSCSCPSLFTGQRCDYLAESPFTTSKTFVTLPTTTRSITTPANTQVVTTDAVSPMGNYSLVQQTTISTTPRVVSEVRRPYEDPDILIRKTFLQNNARITFRTPKISSAEENSGNKVPLTVIDRKLLPLPIFLPRVHEVIPNRQSPRDGSREPTPIILFDVGNDQIIELERNQIDENRRFLRHQEDTSDFNLPDLVEAESNEKRFPLQERIIRVNSFNRPFLVSAGASVLPRANPFSSSTLRQPATQRPKQIQLMQSSAKNKPISSSTPKATTTIPVTTTKRTEIKEEEIFETQESILQPQTNAGIDPTGSPGRNKNARLLRHDDFLRGGAHIETHFSPDIVPTDDFQENKSARHIRHDEFVGAGAHIGAHNAPDIVSTEDFGESKSARHIHSDEFLGGGFHIGAHNTPDIDSTGDLEDSKGTQHIHYDEFLGGGVHIGAHFAPHENKAFHEAFIELRKV